MSLRERLLEVVHCVGTFEPEIAGVMADNGWTEQVVTVAGFRQFRDEVANSLSLLIAIADRNPQGGDEGSVHEGAGSAGPSPNPCSSTTPPETEG